jgi:hypothetical protein
MSTAPPGACKIYQVASCNSSLAWSLNLCSIFVAIHCELILPKSMWIITSIVSCHRSPFCICLCFCPPDLFHPLTYCILQLAGGTVVVCFFSTPNTFSRHQQGELCAIWCNGNSCVTVPPQDESTITTIYIFIMAFLKASYNTIPSSKNSSNISIGQVKCLYTYESYVLDRWTKLCFVFFFVLFRYFTGSTSSFLGSKHSLSCSI